MEFFEAVQKRRSCRRYTTASVPPEVVQKALESALLAPNSSNMQPWEFYWLRGDLKKKQLVEACLSQPAAATAAELVVAVARRDTFERNLKLMVDRLSQNPHVSKSVLDYYRKIVPMAFRHGILGLRGCWNRCVAWCRGWFAAVPRGPFSNQQLMEVLTKSTALACENFMLAITAQGYGSCPMEGFDEIRVKKILRLPRDCRVVMVISVGEVDPKGIFGPQLRFDSSLFIHNVN